MGQMALAKGDDSDPVVGTPKAPATPKALAPTRAVTPRAPATPKAPVTRPLSRGGR